MKFEVEQKFPVSDRAAIERRLTSLGVQAQPALVQADLYFAHPARDFAKSDEALRIRRVGDSNFVTYKGPKVDAKTKTRRELELPLTAGDAAAEDFRRLLEALGFRPVAEVRKRRTPWHLEWQAHSVEVAVDEVANLGTFVELEIGSDEPGLAAAQKAMAELSTELGLNNSERRSYLELLLAAAG